LENKLAKIASKHGGGAECTDNLNDILRNFSEKKEDKYKIS